MGRPPKKYLPVDLTVLLEQVGKNVCHYRLEKQITQSELARISKVSITTINEIETKQFRDIRLATLVSIAKALDISAVQLLQSPNVRMNSRDQQMLLKASEDIWKITQRMRAK